MRLIVICSICLVLAGCASGPLSHVRATRTDAVTTVQGEAKGLTFLGLFEAVTPTYGQAMANLHSKVGKEINEEGYALENVSRKSSSANFLFFSIPKKTVIADVVPRALNQEK